MSQRDGIESQIHTLSKNDFAVFGEHVLSADDLYEHLMTRMMTRILYFAHNPYVYAIERALNFGHKYGHEALDYRRRESKVSQSTAIRHEIKGAHILVGKPLQQEPRLRTEIGNITSVLERLIQASSLSEDEKEELMRELRRQ